MFIDCFCFYVCLLAELGLLWMVDLGDLGVVGVLVEFLLCV